MAYFDPAQAVQQPNGGWLAPRTDISTPGRYFVALDSAKQLSGFIQVFSDGTAAYWHEPNEQAKRARSLEEAFAEIFIVRATSTIMTCPKCRSPYTEECTSKEGATLFKCAKCGTVMSGLPQ